MQNKNVVLGPMLLNIYVSDIVQINKEWKIQLFAV